MTETRIQAVLFDYGLVLTGPPDPIAWQLLRLVLGAEEEPFHAAYWHHRDDYDRGTLTAEAYWNNVAADLNQQLEPEAVRGLVAADTKLWTAPNQPMIDWAASLHRAGIKTGILSNIGDAMEAGVLCECAWLRDFTHHTFSHRLKITKPDPAIYKHASEGLETPPAQILFIDDRAENIAAARAAGMTAIQYRDHQQFLKDMRAAGFEHLLEPEVA